MEKDRGFILLFKPHRRWRSCLNIVGPARRLAVQKDGSVFRFKLTFWILQPRAADTFDVIMIYTQALSYCEVPLNAASIVNGDRLLGEKLEYYTDKLALRFRTCAAEFLLVHAKAP